MDWRWCLSLLHVQTALARALALMLVLTKWLFVAQTYH
jgi:hypothetical protein